MENNLGFDSKNDRNEFFIAIAVILFFLWLFWGLRACNSWMASDKISPDAVVSDTLIADADGDGVLDSLDHCPTLEGPAYNYGCPADDSSSIDTDGDGIIDTQDQCPTLYAKTQDGCPAKSDSDRDGDGTPDNQDQCPDVAGPTERKGCPQDTDGDGVIDIYDDCPETKGLADNNGCPQESVIPTPIAETAEDTAVVTEEEAEVLQRAKYGVEFETASATLKPQSTVILDDIDAIMTKHPEAKLAIVGHTDSQGDDAYNLQLSKERAHSCATYLQEKGISADRIAWSGKGETSPVATNDTEEGRAKNRRVEFVVE